MANITYLLRSALMSAKSLLFALPSPVLFFLKYQTDDVLFQV